MASSQKRVAENAPGELFVDSSCIDCDTCRWLAPETFGAAEEHAFVARQPSTPAERHHALMALVACPTGSIGSMRAREARPEIRAASAAFPDLIADRVYHCGFHDEASFGAASYLIVREAGNVLVDVPRFALPLVRRIEALGGVRWLFLTHRDDVGDHQKFRDRFRCERVLHRDDLSASTRGVERLIDGVDTMRLDDELTAIPVPGHTRGSMCLLYRERFLMSGDHVAWSEDLGQIHAFRDACWFDWDRQRDSMRRLLGHRFEWILPGHGRRCHFPASQMRRELEKCLEWMGRSQRLS